jgi:DNA-binding MarR family transcriptional regulator
MQQTPAFETIFKRWIELFMHKSIGNFMHFAKENGMSMSQFGALMKIKKGTCGVSVLSDGLGVTNAATSQMLERLVQQGLILRSEDAHDRRVKQIVLTEKGQQVLKDGMSAQQTWLRGMESKLTDVEKGKIAEALSILVETANQLEADEENKKTNKENSGAN